MFGTDAAPRTERQVRERRPEGELRVGCSARAGSLLGLVAV
jgi:hypothetical protein